MKQPDRYGKAGLLPVLALVLSILACNFPVGTPTPVLDLEEVVRQTLAATLMAAPPALTPALPPADATQAAPFAGLSTATQPPVLELTPGATASAPPAPLSLPEVAEGATIQYLAQSGDSLLALSRRFGVAPEAIFSSEPVPPAGLIPPGQLLSIPNTFGALPPAFAALPDSEVIFSPTSSGFDSGGYIQTAGGYLGSYSEAVNGVSMTGTQIIDRLAAESSTNPRLLLAVLEFRGGWVFGQPTGKKLSYPIGFEVPGYIGLYKELSLAAKSLRLGYYGWRAGEYSELALPGGTWQRIDPRLNAGSAAVQALLANFYRSGNFEEALYSPGGLIARYTEMFGDPWERATAVEPLFPAGLASPELVLPFPPGERWSLTGGPHAAWLTHSPRGAIDFAPVTGEKACAVSRAWVTAVGPGLVVRAANNMVVLDLDGDGREETGWTILYLHVAGFEQVQLGTYLKTGDPVGHPSCEGGSATGTHIHIARKYNGEWLAADGPLPMLMSGWLVRQGERPYLGYLVRGEQVVTARPDGSHTSIIIRE